MLTKFLSGVHHVLGELANSTATARLRWIILEPVHRHLHSLGSLELAMVKYCYQREESVVKVLESTDCLSLATVFAVQIRASYQYFDLWWHVGCARSIRRAPSPNPYT